MHPEVTSQRVLSLVLWLTALHSLAVGIGLLILPDTALPFFGFDGENDRFFRSQGGVFHLVMVMAYIWAAQSKSGRDRMIEFAVFAKFAATIFLLSYYFIVEPIWSVLGSAVSDFLMACVIYLIYRQRLHTGSNADEKEPSKAGWRHA